MPIPTPQQNNNGSEGKPAQFLRIVKTIAQTPTERSPNHQEDMSLYRNKGLNYYLLASAIRTADDCPWWAIKRPPQNIQALQRKVPPPFSCLFEKFNNCF